MSEDKATYNGDLPSPPYGSGPYWYAEYVRERKKHMAAIRAVSAANVVANDVLANASEDVFENINVLLEAFRSYVVIFKELKAALNGTEGGDDN